MRLFSTALAFALCTTASTSGAPLGVVHKGDQTLLALTYVNPGKTSVRIDRIAASCDCLEVLDKPAEVAPGGVFTVHVVHHALNVGSVDVDVKLLAGASNAVIADFPVRGFIADPSWSVTREEAQARGTVLIDTRAPGPFARIHAARAVNIPAFAIKARRDLKRSRIVLVDDGVEPADALDVVASLRKLGFAGAFALEGGLPGWIRGGGAVEGPDRTVLGSARVSAADFFRSSRDTNWRIVGLGETLPASLGIGEAYPLDRPENLEGALGALSKSWGNESAPHILIISPGDGVHARLEARLGAARGLPVYYLKGGADALVRFRAQQIDAASNTGALARSLTRTETPAIASHCASCGR